MKKVKGLVSRKEIPQLLGYRSFTIRMRQFLIEHEVVSVFISEIPRNFNIIMVPNPQEVMSTKWMTITSVLKEIDQSPKIFTEWFKIYMKEYSIDILG